MLWTLDGLESRMKCRQTVRLKRIENNKDNNNNHDDYDSKSKAVDPCLIVLVQCLLAFDPEAAATPDFLKLI